MVVGGGGTPVSPWGGVEGPAGLMGLCFLLPSLVLISLLLADCEPRLFLHQPQYPPSWIPAHEPPGHNGAEAATEKGTQEFM